MLYLIATDDPIRLDDADGVNFLVGRKPAGLFF